MKKILGLPIALFLVGLIVIGGATAAIVNYLSNTAIAEVTVENPAELSLGNINGEVDDNGGFTVEEWTDDLDIPSTTSLGTAELGVKVVNNADFNIEGKWLQVKVSNNLNNVDCGDITNLEFWDTATPIQIAKGYQNLTFLCEDKGTYIIYNVPVNSLGAGQTYKYPTKMTFGVVEPTAYTISAQMLNTV